MGHLPSTPPTEAFWKEPLKSSIVPSASPAYEKPTPTDCDRKIMLETLLKEYGLMIEAGFSVM